MHKIKWPAVFFKKKNITTWDQINDRILQVQIELKNHLHVAMVVYAPSEDVDLIEIKMFYSTLTRPLDKIRDQIKLTIIGDLNA